MAQARPQLSSQDSVVSRASAIGPDHVYAAIIPIEQQPFFQDLIKVYSLWKDTPLNSVVGDSPRSTLLNFYAVMSLVFNDIKQATANAADDPGFDWSPPIQRTIDRSEELFALAKDALDTSIFPESVRDELTDEAAIQLKEILDYVLTHSRQPILIPSSRELKLLNDVRSKASDSWTMPQTSITLTGESRDPDAVPGFLFSTSTVRQLSRDYKIVHARKPITQPFSTPDIYLKFIQTPGYLGQPKWYLRLPLGLRTLCQALIGSYTVLQLFASSVVVLIYLIILFLLGRQLASTYRYRPVESTMSRRAWHLDHQAWFRVVLLFPIMPLTRMGEIFVDQVINFSGSALVAVTYLFFVCYFVASSLFFFYLLEALGRSLSHFLASYHGAKTELQLLRISNLVIPVCRFLGTLIAIAFIYRLLILLGLPASTVLAFSAVPGLAIGLGASKLLGNLFAGLSIQTDRPLRVGEFCRIGDNLGFVTRIGLRSLELQTLESRVTIPNAIADEQTIVNFSRRTPNVGEFPMQSLDLRINLDESLSPEQLDDLLQRVRDHVSHSSDLQEALISYEADDSGGLRLMCHTMVRLNDWATFVHVREHLLLRLQELFHMVRLSRIHLAVSYDTSAEQLDSLPDLVKAAVHADPLLSLKACRLMSIDDYAYTIVIRLGFTHTSLRGFKDSIHQLNKRLLSCLAEAGIEIPFPTMLQLQREV